MNITRLAIDLAKDVFQLYGVNQQQQSVLTKRINSRQKFMEFIAILRAGTNLSFFDINDVIPLFS